MSNTLTQTEKNELFDRIITNNAFNKFVFEQLKQAIVNSHIMIIPFIGAGLSAFAYKGWGALVQDLLDQLADEEIDNPRRKKIQKKIDNGDFFSAADDLEDLIASDTFYYSLVSAYNENVLNNEKIPSEEAIIWIPKLFDKSRIITTNYDCVLEIAYAQYKKHLKVYTPRNSPNVFSICAKKPVQNSRWIRFKL